MSGDNFSGITQKYAKIMGVALAILCAIGALFFLYSRYFKDPQVKASTTTHLALKFVPSPITQSAPTSPQVSSIFEESFCEEDCQKLGEEESQKPQSFHSSYSLERSDEVDLEFAKELSNELQELNDRELANTLQEEELDFDQIELFFALSKNDLNATFNEPNRDIPPLEEKNYATPLSPQEESERTPICRFHEVDAICTAIAEKICIDPSYSAVKVFAALDPEISQEALKLLNEIVSKFEETHSISSQINYGDPVPTYFANIIAESHDDRQYRSLVGIRNLLRYGPEIIDDFARKHFLGGKHHYEYGEGLQAFEYYTGNLVDMDTELKASNDRDALEEAKQHIVHFGEKYGLKARVPGKPLTAERVAELLPYRKLDLPPSPYHPIFTAFNNMDRSNHGVWKRLTQDENGLPIYRYYVNVPNIELVLVATLKLPYLIATLAHRVKEENKGILPEDFFNEFCKDGLSSKCFNHKTETFLQFYHNYNAKLDKVPTPEEEASKKITQGDFGEALRKKGPEIALQEAWKWNNLFDEIMDGDSGDYSYGSTATTSFEEWRSKQTENIIHILREKELWEKVLCRDEEGNDYFLLDIKTLNAGFLNQFWEYLKIYV